jgi:mycoredoxin
MTEIVMYSTAWCGDCRRARRVFSALAVPYRYVDIERDDAAAALVLRLNAGMRRVPTIVLPDGRTLAEPSNVELEAALAPYRAG